MIFIIMLYDNKNGRFFQNVFLNILFCLIQDFSESLNTLTINCIKVYMYVNPRKNPF